jgi:predicted transcriptional regulator
MVTSTPTKRVRAKAARSFKKASSQETQQVALQQTPQSHCESHRDRLLAALSIAPRLTAAEAARLKRVVQEAREESVGDLPA